MSESAAAADTRSATGAISPAPTPEEAAAIVAAVEALWPRPVYQVEEQPRRSVAWRFSGRWWSRPLPNRRERPFR